MPREPFETFDVTAGRRARAIARRPDTAGESPDPTAGRGAQVIARHPEAAQPIVDPTDPRCGQVPRARATR